MAWRPSALLCLLRDDVGGESRTGVVAPEVLHSRGIGRLRIVRAVEPRPSGDVRASRPVQVYILPIPENI